MLNPRVRYFSIVIRHSNSNKGLISKGILFTHPWVQHSNKAFTSNKGFISKGILFFGTSCVIINKVLAVIILNINHYIALRSFITAMGWQGLYQCLHEGPLFLYGSALSLCCGHITAIGPFMALSLLLSSCRYSQVGNTCKTFSKPFLFWRVGRRKRPPFLQPVNHLYSVACVRSCINRDSKNCATVWIVEI